MPVVNKKTILDILEEQGVIDKTEKELIKIKSEDRKKSIEEILFTTKKIDPIAIAKAYRTLFNFPFVRLKGVFLPPYIILRISKEEALKFKIIPFGYDEGILRLAIVDPHYLSKERENFLNQLSKKQLIKTELYVTPLVDFQEAVRWYDKISSQKKEEVFKKIAQEIEAKKTFLQKQEKAAEERKKREIEAKKEAERLAKEKERKMKMEEKLREEAERIRKREIERQKEEKFKKELLEKTILTVLLKQGAISENQFKEIKEEAVKKGENEASVLKKKNIVSASDLAKAYSEIYKIPYINLKDREIKTEVLLKFPLNIVQTYSMVVFDQIGDKVLKVALADPENKKATEILDLLTAKNKYEIDLYITDKDSLDYAISLYPKKIKPAKEAVVKPIAPLAPVKPLEEIKPPRKPLAVPPPAVSEVPEEAEVIKEEVLLYGVEEEARLRAEELSTILEEEIKEVKQLEEIVKTKNVPKIVAALFSLAIFKKASDIHIEPFEKEISIRLRIDGILRPTINLPLLFHAPIVARIKILGRLKIDETRIPQDGRCEVTIANKAVDLRISTFPTVHGEKIVLRLLEKEAKISTLEELGVSGINLIRVNAAIEKPYGIILSTGPTGAGKSTTLYAILTKLNKPGVNIVTLEDPVEYRIKGINQSQVKPEIDYSFANGLRAILRQDPNIIMVGEIRDSETAILAIQAALTGHLVLSTLHTNDAASAIPRLIDLGAEPFLVASSLICIMAQRLVRRICPACKTQISLPVEILEKIKEKLASLPEEEKRKINFDKMVFYKGKGCDNCLGEGYKGRIAIFETLLVSDKIEELTIKKAIADEIKNVAIKEGMITMEQDGLLKALAGITTVDEVMRATML